MKNAVFLGTDIFITGNCNIKKMLNISIICEIKTKFCIMNFTKMAKLNSKANTFGIWFLWSGASEIIQNYEKVCPALILNHILANKARDIHVWRSMKTPLYSFISVWKMVKLLSVILLVNTCESCTRNQVPSN